MVSAALPFNPHGFNPPTQNIGPKCKVGKRTQIDDPRSKWNVDRKDEQAWKMVCQSLCVQRKVC